VFRTAYRITGNAADAEDVLQTVFLRLLRRDRSAAVLENQESYLRRAAVNVAIDVVRSGAGKVPIDSAPPGSSAPTDRRELRDCLRRALASLNGREAEIFALRFFEDQSNPEIARALGISQVHVAFRYFRPVLQARIEIRNERPVRVDADGIHGKVLTASGPWRTSGYWWTTQPWNRDEWEVALAGGALYRVYRQSDAHWFVEGSYD
jgi:RNA polymerase sigma-70 factor (ECF subfamily)